MVNNNNISSRIIVLNKGFNDENCYLEDLPDIAIDQYEKVLGYTFDDMFTDEMKQIFKLINKYSERWVFFSEGSYIDEHKNVIGLYQELKKYSKSTSNKYLPAIIEVLEYAIKYRKKVYFDF